MEIKFYLLRRISETRIRLYVRSNFGLIGFKQNLMSSIDSFLSHSVEYIAGSTTLLLCFYKMWREREREYVEKKGYSLPTRSSLIVVVDKRPLEKK